MTMKTISAKNKRAVQIEIDIENAIADAFSQISELGDEMDQWRDGLEERLSHTQKYDEVSQAADELTYIEEPDTSQVNLDLSTTIVATQDQRKRLSRAARRDNATSLMRAVADRLDEEIQLLEELRDQLNESADAADQVEFPGMYG